QREHHDTQNASPEQPPAGMGQPSRRRARFIHLGTSTFSPASTLFTLFRPFRPSRELTRPAPRGATACTPCPSPRRTVRRYRETVSSGRQVACSSRGRCL